MEHVRVLKNMLECIVPDNRISLCNVQVINVLLRYCKNSFEKIQAS